MAAPIGNTYWMNRERHGRPKDWESVEAMQEAITAYFDECREYTVEVVAKSGAVITVDQPQVPTIEGLARVLGMDRHTINLYEKEDGYEDYYTTIKSAKAYIQDQKAYALINGRGSTTGLIFDLKNNHGYVDKATQEHTGANGGPIQTAALTPEDVAAFNEKFNKKY